MMKRTPMRVVASVKRGMSGHATVEEATGMRVNGFRSFLIFAKLRLILLRMHCYCYYSPSRS